MNIYVEYSEVSCGVHQLYGFTATEFNGRPSKAKTDLLVSAVFRSIIDDFSEHGRDAAIGPGPCLHYLFSDVAGRGADKFLNYIRKTWPAQEVAVLNGKNPNSGHKITTVLWKPDFAELRKHPLWEVEHKKYERGPRWDMNDDEDGEW